MPDMDPYAVLGVAPGASAAEITAAYRRRAREWHPDLRGSERAALEMIQINAAYEALRSRMGPGGAEGSPSGSGAVPGSFSAREPEGSSPGGWLSSSVRSALGPELVSSLRPLEAVAAFGSASTWDSPRTFVVLTDSRLVWLLDDAVGHRVRSLARSRIASVTVRTGGFRRREATLRIRPHGGRALAFAEMSPAAAHSIADSLRSPPHA